MSAVVERSKMTQKEKYPDAIIYRSVEEMLAKMRISTWWS